MTEATVLMERHNAGDGVLVELLYAGGNVIQVRLSDPLGIEVTDVPPAQARDYFDHPYALAFPGRNPWERVPGEVADEDDSWQNSDEIAESIA